MIFKYVNHTQQLVEFLLVRHRLISPNPWRIISSPSGGVWSPDALQVPSSFLAREQGEVLHLAVRDFATFADMFCKILGSF